MVVCLTVNVVDSIVMFWQLCDGRSHRFHELVPYEHIFRRAALWITEKLA